LTVPTVYLMAREMGGRRLALLTATLTATTVWHLALSRIGLRAISLPLMIALALWLLWRGRRTGQRWQFILAGLCFGAASYTYLAARFTFIALLGFGTFYYIFNLDFNLNAENRAGRTVFIRKTDALLFLSAAVLVLFPLLLFGIGHWDIFVGRAGQVSIFNPTINKGDLWGTLLRHIGRAWGMFFFRGDFIPRHNVPLRPVFDPLIAVAFILGLIRLLRERHRSDRTLTLVWLTVMIIPTIIAEDAPHFLRAVGLQPLLFLIPALGLEAAWQWLEKHTSRAMARGLVALVLLASLGLTVRDYFFRYNYRPWLDVLAPNREIRVREGGLERGDLEETAYPLYLTMQASPARVQNVLARLEGGLELIDCQLETIDSQHLRVTLRWSATEPIPASYTAFVQLLQDGRLVAQDDAPPGTRYLPTHWWRPGDVIVDEHYLELDEPYREKRAGQQMIAGLYKGAGQKRLSVLDENGQPHGDYISLDPPTN
jgi:4-amino-4-deoxy-L-arabinose transferase-like glycosyltransferase